MGLFSDDYREKATMSKGDFLDAARSGNLEKVKHAIENCDMPIDVVDSANETALYDACRNNRYKVTEYLLSKGANPNHLNNRGNHALIIATSHNRKEMVSLLLENGANKHISGNCGTALDWANTSNRRTNIDISNMIRNYHPEGWKKTGEQIVEHYYSEDNNTRHIKDVFNFHSEERTRYVDIVATKQFGFSTTSFKNISSSIMQEAKNQLAGNGDRVKKKSVRTVIINK